MITPGCGFHMQGRAEYAPELKSLYVVIPDQSTDLAKQLRRSLRISDLDLAASENGATAVLQIMTDDSGRKVESVSALNRPQEFEIHFRGALKNGCSREELRDVLEQITIYCGVPAGIEGFRIGRRVLDEIDAAD